MAGRLEGKVALVTGAGRGIGRAVAKAFASEGASLVLASRSRGELEQTAAEVASRGAACLAHPCDVADPAQVRALVSAATQRFGRIDVLVNNACLLGPRLPVSEFPPQDWEAVIQANVNGLFYIIKEALPGMLARRRGSIINVTSGVGRKGKARWGAYAASKFALEGLTQVLAAESEGTGVRVNALNPGATRTAMRAAAYPEEDPRTVKPPEEVAETFVWLASDESRGIHGQTLDVADRKAETPG